MRIAIFVVTQINNWLEIYKKCSFLQLSRVQSSRIIQKSKSETENTLDYSITIVTRPGRALFEATVLESFDIANNGGSVLKLGGPISRINLYGNQSYCVDDYKMKLYCYCLK